MTTSIQQRATGIYDITVRDDAEALINLSGCELIFQARDSITDPDIVIDKRTDDGIEHAADQSGAGKGLAVMTIDADEVTTAASLRFGLWLVDVDDNRWPLIERGVFIIKESVVDPEDMS